MGHSSLIIRLVLTGFRPFRDREYGSRWQLKKLLRDGDYIKVSTFVLEDGRRYYCTRYTPDIDPDFPDEWDDCYRIAAEADQSPGHIGGKLFSRRGSTAEQVLAFLRSPAASPGSSPANRMCW